MMDFRRGFGPFERLRETLSCDQVYSIADVKAALKALLENTRITSADLDDALESLKIITVQGEEKIKYLPELVSDIRKKICLLELSDRSENLDHYFLEALEFFRAQPVSLSSEMGMSYLSDLAMKTEGLSRDTQLSISLAFICECWLKDCLLCLTHNQTLFPLNLGPSDILPPEDSARIALFFQESAEKFPDKEREFRRLLVMDSQSKAGSPRQSQFF
jgi:hypothetical protein